MTKDTPDSAPRDPSRTHSVGVLLAVHEPEAQDTVERILRAAGHIEILGAATNGPEVIRLTEQLRPSIVIIDVELPMMNGFVATKEIMIRNPTPVLIIGGRLEGLSSMAKDSAYRAGALGYLPEIPSAGDEQMAQAFLDVVERVAASKAARYWRIRQAWATDAQIQAIAVLVSNASVMPFVQMLGLLPQDFVAPIIVLPYIGKGFTAGFAGWLRRNCTFTVRVANDRDLLERATVYVAPDDLHLEIAEERIPMLRVSSGPAVGIYRPSGIYLLGTLARVYGPRGLAVVMEGVREDLLSAVCGMWLEGGRVFAQASTRPGWCHWPPEQILLKLADAVMTPAELGTSLPQMVAVHGAA